eukprot:CAMPEP_0177760558 /NCGR_PEP_ID=MMETSP0491_2-20121128/5329_1 /TAXON_ID=63592 /ORGANISM="Tetraselmis chuii, Strain PLY429" /LENGTH=224 /DNA_ID=CAMNT_0019276461 /DNA_START=264 /DNA_END=940 /DNA_ORIENTATION=-
MSYKSNFFFGPAGERSVGRAAKRAHPLTLAASRKRAADIVVQLILIHTTQQLQRSTGTALTVFHLCVILGAAATAGGVEPVKLLNSEATVTLRPVTAETLHIQTTPSASREAPILIFTAFVAAVTEKIAVLGGAGALDATIMPAAAAAAQPHQLPAAAARTPHSKRSFRMGKAGARDGRNRRITHRRVIEPVSAGGEPVSAGGTLRDTSVGGEKVACCEGADAV